VTQHQDLWNIPLNAPESGAFKNTSVSHLIADSLFGIFDKMILSSLPRVLFNPLFQW
jgi:hypothetical protein